MDFTKQRRMLVTQAAAFMSRLGVAQNARPQMTYAPMSTVDEECQASLDKIYNCNDIECVNILRMRRAPFFNLCNLLRDRNLLRDTKNSSVEEQVAMFLHVVGRNQRFRVIHQTFRRSMDTVRRYFREVLYAIGELREQMMTIFGTGLATGKYAMGSNEALGSPSDCVVSTLKTDYDDGELYGAVMYMPGFTEEALICAFSHLADNKAQGDAFVKMTDPHRVRWLRTWLAKHYYM